MAATDECITVYVTQWALTDGIQERRGRHTKDAKMIELIKVDGVHNWHLHKPHWHLTRKDAVVLAKAMQAKRIASLETSLAEVKALTFEE
jgi:hypothetical protein